MAEHGGENFVGVARINGERGNLLSIDETEMGPGLAGIGRLVDAIADGKIGAVQSLAAAYINDVGVRRSDRDGSDRLGRLVIENRIPGAAVVVRFPDAAIHLGDIEHVGLAGHAGGRAGAPATEWTNHAPVQFLVSIFWNLRPARRCGQKNHETKR